jgi:excisionase family DNA binding protein
MMTHEMEPLTVRPRDAARLLGMTEPTVRGMIARGQLPAVRWGRRVLIRTADLHAQLKGLPSARRA